MNKTLIISLFMMIFSPLSFAQDKEEDNDDDKRPSWSPGLPERQSAKDLNKPDFKPEMDNEIELDMSEFGIKPKADIEIEMPIEGDLPAGEVKSAESIEQERLEQERLEQERLEQERLEQERLEQERLEQELLEQAAKEPDVTTDSPAIEQSVDDSNDYQTETSNGQYEWKIIKQTPVEYPVKAAIDNLEGWVDVEVTIDSAGEVVSATPVKYSRRGRIFGKSAIQSVNDWLFDPPSNSGINEPQTRIYRIEFEL